MAKHRNITKTALVVSGLLTACPAFAFDAPPPRTASEAAECVIGEYAHWKHQVERAYSRRNDQRDEQLPALMSQSIANAVAAKCRVQVAEQH
jgi:hypothetical protein